ncbi:MAG: S10 family peptidase [Luteolibacter sp.]
MNLPRTFTISFACLLLNAPIQAEESAKSDGNLKSSDEKRQNELPDPITRKASISINGKKIDYQATVASMRIAHGDDAADIFYVAYERDIKSAPSTRPVMFAFNGGPGSSAVWLHIGMLGPKILKLPGDGTQPPKPPVTIQDNEQSILDICDIVFIDPVSTGYSRAEDEKKANNFHGLDADIESVGEFIRRWVTENNRWASPKYLLGESYGGVRAAGLAKYLQSRHGMSLNGVVLLSAILDFATIQNASGQDQSHSIFLPAYAAVAHHHGKLQGNRDALVAKAKTFAFGEYATALIHGSELTHEQKTETAAKLEAYSGIPAATWLKHQLRINPSLFRAELLREEQKTIGRFDARVAWAAPYSQSLYPAYDPSYSLALGAFSTALKDYLGRELGYKLDEPYEIITGKVHPWKWNGENRIVNVSERLATAMRDNPHLKVLVMSGHADLATPPECVAHSLRHIHGLPEELRGNISTAYYEAGHMFYLNAPDLKKSRKDLVKFIASE